MYQHLNQWYLIHKHTHLHTKEKPKHETSPLKLNENFMIEIRNDEKNINNIMFKWLFWYQKPSFLAKKFQSS